MRPNFQKSWRRSGRMFFKRFMDTLLIIISAPLTVPLGLIIAVLIRINLGSPIIFKQERIGLNELPFTLLKFRSMLPEVDSKGNLLSGSDRLTLFGRLLRKSSLDELPQLINILRGEMALVGPRPLLAEYLPYYRESERIRHSVRPGITGRSQTCGRNNLGWDERLSLDVEYVQNATFIDDLKILFNTVLGVLMRKDAISEPWSQGEYLSVYRSYPSSGDYALRRFEPGDIEVRVKWMNDERVKESMTLEGEITIESTRKWLRAARKNPLRKDLVLYNVKTSETVAIAGYKFEDTESLPTIYFAVNPNLHGRGIGHVLVQLLIDYMKMQENVHGAAGEVYKNNERSIRLHERLGFTQVESALPDDRLRMEIEW